jgi:hypothetical protein
MAELGGAFPEAVGLLQQADKCECLSCRVRYDVLREAPPVDDLVQAGREGGSAELVPGGQDLGLTPNLYDAAPAPDQDRLLRASRRDDRAAPGRTAARRAAKDE